MWANIITVFNEIGQKISLKISTEILYYRQSTHEAWIVRCYNNESEHNLCDSIMDFKSLWLTACP